MIETYTMNECNPARQLVVVNFLFYASIFWKV